MKTKVLLVVGLLIVGAASAQAATSIIGSKHDLSSNMTSANSVHSSNQNQTCVFCHAPHNAVTNKLLWNRVDPGMGTMKIYTSYNTGAMRTALTQNVLGSDSSSLLCLSCHALSTAADVINNTANNKGGTPASYTPGTFPSVTGNMNNLTNDHPVGINYDAAQTVATAAGLNASVAGKVGTLRLFKSAVSAASSLECASCHSVHDNTNTKFLAMSNTNSAMCIVCHVK